MTLAGKEMLEPRGIVLGLLFPAAGAIAAFATGFWVLMALPLGFLFGFFLQKGDLCGAAGCSEVLLFRSWEKLRGIWVCIVTGMAGFALLDLLGWVELNPKPFQWLILAAGGAVFGVGTVFAGGCVTGCLYKSGTGNLNAIAAVTGMPLGITAVYSEFFRPLRVGMEKYALYTDRGGAVTLPTLTGLPFWAIAAALLVFTLGVALFLRRGRAKRPADPPSLSRALARSWKPWQSGVAIGLLALPAYVCAARSGHNYPLGTTGGLYYSVVAAVDRDAVIVWKSGDAPDRAGAQKESLDGGMKPVPDAAEESFANSASDPSPSSGGAHRRRVILWVALLDASLVAGAWWSARLSGRARLLPKPREQVILAFLGGILLGFGAALGGGCFYGHVVSGWALMSAAGFLFGGAMLLTNWATTYFYLMGGSAIKGK
jgi:uncharacterized membrane protein YedE/YeeE